VHRIILALLLPLMAISAPSRGTVEVSMTSTTGSTTAGTLAWPLRGPIVRGYEQPSNPYASGHRGMTTWSEWLARDEVAPAARIAA